LVTERVKELIMDRQLTNCALIPSHKLEWGSGVTPEGSHARTLELAARPLESLLADLEDPELINDAIYGLGCKGDARAVEPLIRKFDDPDSSIPGSAADAIASIVKHKETPEHTREEIFSKLCVLLGHNDPVVRKSAARALSSTRSERAAREIMRLFDDPDEWVRATVVWELGCHRYKPALDSVRRLTRDRSELVREIARMMVYRIEFDSP
jgi:HEAT repeat protein